MLTPAALAEILEKAGAPWQPSALATAALAALGLCVCEWYVQARALLAEPGA
jgi:hypothetical protein